MGFSLLLCFENRSFQTRPFLSLKKNSRCFQVSRMVQIRHTHERRMEIFLHPKRLLLLDMWTKFRGRSTLEEEQARKVPAADLQFPFVTYLLGRGDSAVAGPALVIYSEPEPCRRWRWKWGEGSEGSERFLQGKKRQLLLLLLRASLTGTATMRMAGLWIAACSLLLCSSLSGDDCSYPSC